MNNQTEYRTMTPKGSNKSVADAKALMAEEEIFGAPMMYTVIQEFLEAEMAKRSARKRESESKGA